MPVMAPTSTEPAELVLLSQDLQDSPSGGAMYLQEAILAELHEGHPGMVRMKGLASSSNCETS